MLGQQRVKIKNPLKCCKLKKEMTSLRKNIKTSKNAY